MYYVLYCDFPRDSAGGFMDIDDGIKIAGVDSWRIGRRIEVAVPQPIVVDAIPIGGYAGPPKEMSSGNLLLMTDRLVQALHEAGVDNFDSYPALLRNTETQQTYGYQAINILGLVAAADLSKSDWRSYDDEPIADVSFESLVLKEDAAGGALFFRLAENTGTIVVHRKVRDHILAKGIETLKFIEPKDWVRV